MTMRIHRAVRTLSLLLALSMLLSVSAISSAAETPAPSVLTVSDSTLALVDRDQAFTATLTVDASVLGDASPDAWAAGLTWYLTREEGFQDGTLYPYYYPGDRLDRWQVWNNGEGGDALFTLGDAAASSSGGKVTVTLPFTAGSFTGINGDSSKNRNAWPSFIGTYTLSARSGDTVVAETDMTVNAYDSYVRYDDIDESIQDIIDEALPGRYITVTTFGQSEGGRDQYYVTLSDSKASVDAFQAMNAIAEADPASLQDKLEKGSMGDYRVPFFLNNVHPDEDPGVDAQLNVLRALATQETVTYNTLTGFKDKSVDISEMFAPDVLDLGITGLGSQKFTRDAEGNIQDNTGVNDASELYTISGDITLKVDDILDDIIFVICPNENPDGRTYNTRRNDNGFDLNRDASNQTQNETTNLVQVINDWNPVVFAELHGYMTEFLVEPCTPPHEPNLEYDLLVKNFALGSEAFGTAALGTMSATREEHPDTLYWSYYMPLRDDYDPSTMHWSAWDDLCTNYGPSYAMLNCGSLGYTIETPYNNEASTDLFEYGVYGLIDYVMEHKDDIYHNQLEFFLRGIENEDHRDSMEKWYVDVNNKQLQSDTWRVPYEENDNYFPEYYVIPVDAASQRDPADAYEMGRFLLRNGVRVSMLDTDTAVGGVTYRAGSLVVDMHQAKRNYANAVLWEGADASASGFPDLYSESVTNFPAMRGFDCIPIAAEGAFAGKLTEVSTVTGRSQLTGTAGDVVILSNNGSEAVRAVNALLDAGRTVSLITSGDHKGDFALSLASYETVADDFVLSATRTAEAPAASAIRKPTLFLAGRYDAFSGAKLTEGYFAQWFRDGYGFRNYRNVYSNGTSNYDIETYIDQLGFTVTDDPAKADIIVGNVALDQGEKGAAAVAAVKAGTPYIATGSDPLEYISNNLVTDLTYTTLGMEALHTVTYPTDSLITASYVAEGDDLLYGYGAGYFAAIPAGAQVLVQLDGSKELLEGFLPADGEHFDDFLDDSIQAISYQGAGADNAQLDVVLFANTLTNKTNQRDEYNFISNAAWAAVLNDTGYSDVAPNAWYAEAVAAVTGQGLMNGVTSKAFGPDVTTTRGMLVTVLHRMAGEPAASASAGFADVAAGSYCAAAVDWAYEAGITSGASSTGFAPDSALTREQAVTLLCNYAEAQGLDVSAAADLSGYPDASAVSAFAQDAVAWAVDAGLLTGTGAGTLNPQGTATRAELAALLVRAEALFTAE